MNSSLLIGGWGSAQSIIPGRPASGPASCLDSRNLRLALRPDAISLNALMADCVSGSLNPDGADPTGDRCIERMPCRPRILVSVSA